MSNHDDVDDYPLKWWEPTWKRAWLVLLALVLLVALLLGGVAGCKEFNRYQKRATATNNVKVAKIQATQVRAEIEATKARADKRYEEARGIRKAQDEVSKTLTGEYLQYLAIQAQKEAASAGNAQIYIPSGNQGIPLVRNVDPQTSVAEK